MNRNEFLRLLGLVSLTSCIEEDMKIKHIVGFWGSDGGAAPASLPNQVFWMSANTLSESAGEVTSWTNKFNASNPAVPVGGRNTPNLVTDGSLNAVEFTRANT